jgi:DNA-binding protein HU-beta
MKQSELIARVADRSGLNQGQVGRVLDALGATIADQVKGGGTVRHSGIGSFSLAEREATTGRNPRTGEAIDIPTKRSVKFKAAKSLRDALNPPPASPLPRPR